MFRFFRNQDTVRFRETTTGPQSGPWSQPVAAAPKLDFPIPRITFGVELEMNFVIRRTVFWEWLGHPDPRPARKDFSLGIEYLTISGGQDDDDLSDDERTANMMRKGQAQAGEYQDFPKRRHSNRTDTGGAWFQDHWQRGPFKGETSTTHSSDEGLQLNVRKYMVDFLNGKARNLPSRPQSPLGEVSWAGYHDTDNEFTRWVLTEDPTIGSRRGTYADIYGLRLDDVKPMYVVGGAEVLSPALLYDDLAWTDSFDYLYRNFQFNGDHGMWLNGEGIHVHMSLENEALELDILQNVMVLYGFFEDQIERWMHVRRRHAARSSGWARSLRYGMEMPFRNDPGPRYTPKSFVRRVYDCSSILDLKMEVSGGRGSFRNADFERLTEEEWDSMKYVAVNISLPRDKKPLTLEFRQHDGTEDSQSMIWWVKFCGHLLHHAFTLSQAGFVAEDVHDPSTSLSFVDEVAGKKNILDIISFPQEGKDFFAAKAAALHNQQYEDELELEFQLIEERVRRENLGQRTGEAMDQEIMMQDWWRKRLRELSIRRHELETQGLLVDCPRNPAYNWSDMGIQNINLYAGKEMEVTAPERPPMNLGTNF